MEDGIPYAIDFMNPAPDADVHSVGEKNFKWIVDKVANLAVEKAKLAGAPPKGLTWSSFLMGADATAPKKCAAKKKARFRLGSARR